MNDNEPPLDHDLALAAASLRGWETPVLDAADRSDLWTAIRTRVPTATPPTEPPARAVRPPHPVPRVGALALAIGALAALFAARGRTAVDVGVHRADPAHTAPAAATATVVGRRTPVALRPAAGAPAATAAPPEHRSAVVPQASALAGARPSPRLHAGPPGAASAAAASPQVAPPAPPPVDAAALAVGAAANHERDLAPRPDRPAGTARPTVTPGPVLPAEPLPPPDERPPSPPRREPPPVPPTTAAPAGIAGVVRDAAGVPIARAGVRAVPEGDAARFVVAVADDAGSYKLDLPAGWWHLTAFAAGYAPRWWPDGATPGEAVRVEVTEGHVTDGIDFTLPLYSGP